MPLVDNVWYVDFGNGSSTGYYSVPVWSATTYAVGNIVRQATTPTAGNERCFVCTIAGLATTEPSWAVTRGAANITGAATLSECSGQAGLNGDTTNCAVWVSGSTWVLGQVIYDSTSASLQFCTTAGAGITGTKPTFSATAGTVTSDNVARWTSLGVASGFSAWAATHARLYNAGRPTWGAAGNTFFVASENAETLTTLSPITLPGLLTNPCYVYSVPKSPVPPTSLQAGASIQSTGANTLGIGAAAVLGSNYIWGLSLTAGNSTSAAGLQLNVTGSAASFFHFDTCTLALSPTMTAAGSISLVQANYSKSRFDNCTFNVGGNVGQTIFGTGASATAQINGGSIVVTGTLPTSLFGTGPGAALLLNACDLSSYTSGELMPGVSNSEGAYTVLQDCKIGSGITIAATPNGATQETSIIRCDSGTETYRHEKYNFAGAQTIDTTVVRTGGASDGITPISWKIVTNANARWTLPFECFPLAIWNGITLTNRVLTICGIWGSASLPNNDQVWFEAQYLGSASSVLASIATCTKANNFVAGSPLNADGSTWGGSEVTPFNMAITLSSPQPQQVGLFDIFMKVAVPSTTIWLDPFVTLG